MDNEEILRLCRISLCEPPVETDTDYLTSASPLSGTTNKKFVIEFGCKNYAITVKAGQLIQEDEIIGYMNNKPVRSKIRGTVLEIGTNYIIGKYSTDIEKELARYIGSDLTEEKIKEMFTPNDTGRNRKVKRVVKRK